MKFAVVGAGGVGGYFGGRLLEAGHDVTLIARGKHLDAIKQQGLYISSPDGDVHLSTIKANDNAAEVGVVDAVIVAVKGWQIEAALPNIEPLVGPDTLILPLLNGVEAPEILSRHSPSGNVVSGLCGIIARLDGPGRVSHLGIKPYIKFGELDNTKSERVNALASAFMQTDINVEIPDDIHRAVWQKFIFIAPLSSVTAVARASIDTVRAIPQTRKLLAAAIAETVNVGAARGIDIRENDIQATLGAIDKAPVGGTTSMQRDIEAGKPSELETQTGSVVRFAADQGIATPVNDFLYAALVPQERRARTESD